MDNASPDVVTRPPWRAVRRAMKLLTAVADARTAAEAERRFDQFEIRAEKSSALTNAAYVAAQVLRDMDVLSQTEASYVFSDLFDLGIDDHLKNDADYQARLHAFAKQSTEGQAAADAALRLDHLTRELAGRAHVVEARFHRMRGELGLAELLLRDPDAAMRVAVDGECSLTSGKVGRDKEEADEPNPAAVAAICERIAALATAETSRNTLAEYDAFAAAMGDATIASGMAAVRELRDIGLISFNESINLLNEIVGPLVSDEIDADRECIRLKAKIDALSGDRPPGSGPWPTSGKRARDLRSLEKRHEARANLLLAMCFRRFGEHQVATLLIEDPKEFERQAQSVSLGAWAGPTE